MIMKCIIIYIYFTFLMAFYYLQKVFVYSQNVCHHMCVSRFLWQSDSFCPHNVLLALNHMHPRWFITHVLK